MDETEPRLTRSGKRKSEEEDEQQAKKAKTDEDDTCAICLETLNEAQTDVTTLPCRHRFHSKCIMDNVLKNSLRCPVCRTMCARTEAEEEEDSSEDDMDESMILMVADRIQKKLKKEDVRRALTRFHIPNGTGGLTHREACELLAEQLTHETDDEDEASA
eukprot:5902402-Prymnesium_polylepis.1